MKGRTWRLVASLGLLALLLAAAVLLWRLGLEALWRDPELLTAWIARLGVWGPLGIILAEILQVALAPIPGQVVGLAAGYLYGPWRGAFFCLVGLALGTWIAAGLARQLGRPLVERWARPDLLARLDAYAQRRGAWALFLIFLLPFLPDDLCCLLAGLTPLRLGEIVLLALVGRAPGVIASTLLGAYARTLAWWQLLILGGVSLALALLFWRYQRPLEQRMFRLLDHLLRR
jgi:uncharacterized membrane protein YdjX (TVP38/TMEM64 family)